LKVLRMCNDSFDGISQDYIQNRKFNNADHTDLWTALANVSLNYWVLPITN